MTERGLPNSKFELLSRQLTKIGREFQSRGWVLGTSGNLSAVVSQDPFLLAITGTGIDKSLLTRKDIVQVDSSGQSVTPEDDAAVSRENREDRASAGLESAPLRPSYEVLLHLAIVKNTPGLNSVMHTHSVWSTILSELHASEGGIAIEGYEMLKGLQGVRTHEHREWLPIVDNVQDMKEMAQAVEELLNHHPNAHGFLVRGHGLYTWGRTVAEAKRHVEILEFLTEVTGRIQTIQGIARQEGGRISSSTRELENRP
ncbi:MAG TPA: methylthioribulose 1-phosphate dehydratase [Blastocatellia bacterium]|nr:methylthioribulose 1-phosphate dehydratase [Blastocatellia bacterium]